MSMGPLKLWASTNWLFMSRQVNEGLNVNSATDACRNHQVEFLYRCACLCNRQDPSVSLPGRG